MESIQIWPGQKIPECYRQLFPAASEFDWIAVVAPQAVSDFGHQLLTGGYRIGIDAFTRALADGGLLFYGDWIEIAIAQSGE